MRFFCDTLKKTMSISPRVTIIYQVKGHPNEIFHILWLDHIKHADIEISTKPL